MQFKEKPLWLFLQRRGVLENLLVFFVPIQKKEPISFLQIADKFRHSLYICAVTS